MSVTQGRHVPGARVKARYVAVAVVAAQIAACPEKNESDWSVSRDRGAVRPELPIELGLRHVRARTWTAYRDLRKVREREGQAQRLGVKGGVDQRGAPAVAKAREDRIDDGEGQRRIEAKVRAGARARIEGLRDGDAVDPEQRVRVDGALRPDLAGRDDELEDPPEARAGGNEGGVADGIDLKGPGGGSDGDAVAGAGAGAGAGAEADADTGADPDPDAGSCEPLALRSGVTLGGIVAGADVDAAAVGSACATVDTATTPSVVARTPTDFHNSPMRADHTTSSGPKCCRQQGRDAPDRTGEVRSHYGHLELKRGSLAVSAGGRGRDAPHERPSVPLRRLAPATLRGERATAPARTCTASSRRSSRACAGASCSCEWNVGSPPPSKTMSNPSPPGAMA